MAAAARKRHAANGHGPSPARNSLQLKDQLQMRQSQQMGGNLQAQMEAEDQLQMRQSQQMGGDLQAQMEAEEAVDKDIGGNRAFKIFVDSMIVVNAAQLGMCVQKEGKPDLKEFCDYSEHFFIGIFFIEILYRLYSLGFSYFRSKWNVFDFFLTFVAVLDNWIFGLLLPITNLPVGNFYVLRLARLVRILRILRVLRQNKELQMLMEGLLASLRSMVWVAVLLGFLIYCFSIVCVTLFSTVESDYPLNFHTLPVAIFALFSLAVLGDWTDIVMPVVSAHPWAAMMFVMFTIVGTFGILNLIIGIIAETTIEVQQGFQAQEKLDMDIAHMSNIEEIADIVFATQDDSTITKDELKSFMEHEEHGHAILKLVQDVELPVGFTLQDCHPMFDRDASGSITKHEFIEGMKRLIFSNEFQRAFSTQSAIADVLVEIKAVEGQVLGEVKAVEERLTRLIREELRSLHQDIPFAASVGDAGGNGGGGDAGSGDGTTPQLLARSGIKAMPSEVTSEHRQEAEAGRGIAGVLDQLKAEFGDLQQVVKKMDQQLYPPPGNDTVLEAMHDKQELHALSQRLMRRLREPMFQLLADSLEAEVSAGTVFDRSRHSSNVNGSGDANFAYLATEISLRSQTSTPTQGTSGPAGNAHLAPSVWSQQQVDEAPLIPRLRPGLRPTPRLRSPQKSASAT